MKKDKISRDIKVLNSFAAKILGALPKLKPAKKIKIDYVPDAEQIAERERSLSERKRKSK